MAARNDAFVKPCFELLRKKSSYPLISEGRRICQLNLLTLASFPEVFLLICGPLEDVKQDIENRTFALPEMEKKKSREREYIEWSNVNVSTVNGDINYDEYFRLAD